MILIKPELHCITGNWSLKFWTGGHLKISQRNFLIFMVILSIYLTKNNNKIEIKTDRRPTDAPNSPTVEKMLLPSAKLFLHKNSPHLLPTELDTKTPPASPQHQLLADTKSLLVRRASFSRPYNVKCFNTRTDSPESHLMPLSSPLTLSLWFISSFIRLLHLLVLLLFFLFITNHFLLRSILEQISQSYLMLVLGTF